MRCLGNETDESKRMKQIDEELNRRMAKYDKPENVEYMQAQVNTAICALAHLFGIKDEELDRIVMPKFYFCHAHDSYCPEVNEICMEPEGITPYRIGSITAEFLYCTVNPEIFKQEHKFNLAFVRSLGQPDRLSLHERDYVLSRAYINLITVVKHYCGMFFCQDSCFKPKKSSNMFKVLNSLPQDSEGYDLALIHIRAHYKGKLIAEHLFDHYPVERFKPIVRLSFEEAKARLFYMTGIELLEEDE